MSESVFLLPCGSYAGFISMHCSTIPPVITSRRYLMTKYFMLLHILDLFSPDPTPRGYAPNPRGLLIDASDCLLGLSNRWLIRG